MGPWIFGPIDFLKIAKTENTFPLQFLMTMELGNRRTTSFNESEAGPLVIRQIRLCTRGGSVDLWSNRFSQNCENGKHVPIAIFNDRGIGKSPYYLV